MFIYNKFSHYCRSLPIITKTSIKGKTFTSFTFATRVYPCLTIWHNMFYPEGKKVVSLNLYNMLTYEALAHWIMGDGNWDNSAKTVVICTDTFTLAEVELLITVLKLI